MNLQEIISAFTRGENLVNVIGKIYVLVRIEECRRSKNILDLMNPDTGKKHVCRPDQVGSVLGRIDIAKLPFKVRVIGPLVRDGYIQCPLILPDGAEVHPGELVSIWNHVHVVYLGVNPRNKRTPIMYSTEDGRVYSGPRLMFINWARKGEDNQLQVPDSRICSSSSADS